MLPGKGAVKHLLPAFIYYLFTRCCLPPAPAEPIYSERSAVVSGKTAVEGGDEAGLPGFWLRCMQMNEVVAESITEKDVDVLKSLTDLTWVEWGVLCMAA